MELIDAVSTRSVGAALLCEDGSIIKGCNVENASYGPSLSRLLCISRRIVLIITNLPRLSYHRCRNLCRTYRPSLCRRESLT